MQNIINVYKIEKLEDLNKVRLYVEENNLEKPNFSKLGRELNAYRRTVEKYYNGYKKNKKRKRKSIIDDY